MSVAQGSTSDSSKILRNVGRYYSERVQAFGATAKGVDWNSDDSQQLRFGQLLTVCGDATDYSLLDYGCGYGALAKYPFVRAPASYIGFDISAEMIAKADEIGADRPWARFTTDRATLSTCDFAVASGIFNVRLDSPVDEWQAHVHRTLDDLASLSRRGFSFNMLTSYSDEDRMRSDLYYADPRDYFDHVKRHFSRHVALLHDYGLYEFTLRVQL